MLVYILRDIAFCRSKQHHDGKYLVRCFVLSDERNIASCEWKKNESAQISSVQNMRILIRFPSIRLFSYGIKFTRLFRTLTLFLFLSVFYFSFKSQFPVMGILKALTDLHHRFMQTTFNRFHFPVLKNAVKCLCKWLKFHRILSHSMNFCSVWITELKYLLCVPSKDTKNWVNVYCYRLFYNLEWDKANDATSFSNCSKSVCSRSLKLPFFPPSIFWIHS